MIGAYLTVSLLVLLGKSKASFIRGAKSRTLQEYCLSSKNETSCLNKDCAWCEFNYDMYDPVCMPISKISSLPSELSTCKLREETTEGERESAPGSDNIQTITATNTMPSSIPSTVPSIFPSTKMIEEYPIYEPSASPSLYPTSPDVIGDISEGMDLCADLGSIDQCLSSSCNWCDFSFSATSTCFDSVQILSLPPGYFTCITSSFPSIIPSSEPSASPSSYPSESRNGGTPNDNSASFGTNDTTEPDLSSCAESRSKDQCLASSCNWCDFSFDVSSTCLDSVEILSLPPGYFRCANKDNISSGDGPNGAPQLDGVFSTLSSPSSMPSTSRNGGNPIDEFFFDGDALGSSSEDISSCAGLTSESSCQISSCKWCEFKYGALASVCLNEKQITSLASDLSKCT